MRRITMIAVLAAIAILATAAVANANVAVTDGVGFVGKGDVQTALGYGSGNDAAFQADAAKNLITFKYASNTDALISDVKCSTADILGPDDPFTEAHNVWAGSTTTKTVTFSTKGDKGKVTGFNLTGVTGDGVTSSSYDYSKMMACPTGMHFMGWLNGPQNAWHNETLPGTGSLTVSGNGKVDVALPNTPVA
jgi:hypothetical protein